MEIRFVHGKPIEFLATRQFALGNTGLTVSAGYPILFDGTTAEVDGAKHTLPQLRGAVKAGWLVPAESYEEDNPDYGQPVSANIQMRPAQQTGNNLAPVTKTAAITVENDERIVGSHSQHAAATAEHNASRKGARKQQVVVHDQEGTVVRGGLKTSAKQTTTLTSETAGSAIRAAEQVKIDPGQGVTEEQMLASMTEDQQTAYLDKKNALRSQYVAAEEPKVVSTIKRKASQTQAEGMQFKQSVGGGTSVFDPTGTGGKPVVTETTIEGIKVTNTNGPGSFRKAPVVNADGTPMAAAPKPAPAPAPSIKLPDEVRMAMAKAVCADFPPTYNFSEKPQKRVARLQLDYEEAHDVIRAAYVAETDEVKQMLVAAFPEVFAG